MQFDTGNVCVVHRSISLLGDFFQLLIVINVSPTHTPPLQCHGTLDMSPYSSISHLTKVTHILLLLVVITVLAINVMYLLTTC